MYGYQYDPMQQIQQSLMNQQMLDPQTTMVDEFTRSGQVPGRKPPPGGGGGGGGQQMGQMLQMGKQSLVDSYDVMTNKNEDGSTDLDWDSVKLVGEILMMAFSDRRLKKNILKIGIKDGVNWYSYDYIWDEDGSGNIGVMADEVPHAAHMHPSGYLMVDYNKVM